MTERMLNKENLENSTVLRQYPIPDDAYVDIVVIGGGQAGLAMGYHLAKQGSRFVILDENDRVGSSWRQRWDSLRLFTAAKYNGLPGLPFPGPAFRMSSKDEVADYLEHYAEEFQLPVRLGVKVISIQQAGADYLVETSTRNYRAAHVVIATGGYHTPRIPAYAMELDRKILQLHSSHYTNLQQFQDGDVLVVGAGNSGGQIALDVADGRNVYLSGRDAGYRRLSGSDADASRIVTFLIDLVMWLASRVRRDSFIGEKIAERGLHQGQPGAGPLIGISAEDLSTAGVTRVPRTVGVHNGRPVLADGQIVNVANVIWATGFQPQYGWIENLPVDKNGYPHQLLGVVDGEPGLYFLGLPFQHRLTSDRLAGVGEDAKYLAFVIAERILV